MVIRKSHLYDYLQSDTDTHLFDLICSIGLNNIFIQIICMDTNLYNVNIRVPTLFSFSNSRTFPGLFKV